MLLLNDILIIRIRQGDCFASARNDELEQPPSSRALAWRLLG